MVPPVGVDEPEGVDAEALHRAGTSAGCRGRTCSRSCGAAPRCAARRSPRTCRARVCACGISRSGCGFAGVDDVGELDAVLDEEDRDVVADQVEVALVGVELHREAAGVAHRVGRAARAERRSRSARTPVSRRPSARKRGRREVVDARAVADEDAVRAGAAGVHDPLGDALVVEVGDLLAQVVVLQQGRPARPGLAASGRCRAAARRWTVVRKAPCCPSVGGHGSEVGPGRRDRGGGLVLGRRGQRLVRRGRLPEGDRLGGGSAGGRRGGLVLRRWAHGGRLPVPAGLHAPDGRVCRRPSG